MNNNYYGQDINNKDVSISDFLSFENNINTSDDQISQFEYENSEKIIEQN